MKTEIIDKIALFHIKSHVWSGARRLKAEDFDLGDGGRLPPSLAANLGSKRIYDPAALKPFHRIKRSMERLVCSYGVKFMGGFAVPTDKVEKIAAELELLIAEFNQEKKKLLDNYHVTVDKWLEKCEQEEWVDPIRRALHSKDHVASRISSKYMVFQIADTLECKGDLHSEVEGLSDQLYKEISQQAMDIWNSSLDGGQNKGVTRRIKNSFERILLKLQSLSFLDGKLQNLISLVDNVINGIETLPAGKPIVGDQFNELLLCVQILMDEDRAKQFSASDQIIASSEAVKEIKTEELPFENIRVPEENQSTQTVETESSVIDELGVIEVSCDPFVDEIKPMSIHQENPISAESTTVEWAQSDVLPGDLTEPPFTGPSEHKSEVLATEDKLKVHPEPTPTVQEDWFSEFEIDF